MERNCNVQLLAGSYAVNMGKNIVEPLKLDVKCTGLITWTGKRQQSTTKPAEPLRR